MNVALFVTCLTDSFHPRVGLAVVRVLRHLGCKLHFPDAQTCCGQPAYNNGYHDQAAAMGRRMIDVFAGYDYVVSPSGSCVSMVKHNTPELLRDDETYSAAARSLADRTWEFGRFVDDVLKLDVSKLDGSRLPPMTFHYSCHHRGISTVEQATRLIRELPGVDYRPLGLIDQCCGFGGAFGVMYPDISHAMVSDKLDCIEQTGAEVVVCCESGCTMTMEGAARRRGMKVRFMHLAEVLEQALCSTDEEQ